MASLFSDLIVSTNLVQLVSTPTRFRLNQAPSLLDLILTNDDNLVTNIETAPLIGFSDHIILSCTLQVIFFTQPQNITRHVIKTDFVKFNNQLLSVNWDILNSITDVDGKWDMFLT